MKRIQQFTAISASLLASLPALASSYPSNQAVRTVHGPALRLLMLGSRAEAAASPLLLIDSNTTARPAIAKAFDSADAYAIDPDKQAIYVIRGSQLSVLLFDGPINQSGEHFEESYQSG